MKIAIEGCCHGELDKIYDTLTTLERRNNVKVDLLLLCGDFQAVRNRSDLHAMAVPPKYQRLNTFYKYYSGEKKAPVLTIFIGGNHEASNYLQELPYGGWVAPNIYYLGYAGVVQFGGVRIGGMSGIYKGRDYQRGHFEHPPYSEDTKRSCYHVRNLDVFRLKQLKEHVDIFVSHDWPRGIYNFGNVNRLLHQKKFFREEVESGTLGSPPAEEVLYHMKPSYWFAAHLHVKFAAVVEHQVSPGVKKTTKFLALDKCLPRRNFLQVIDVPQVPGRPMQLELDPEWLSVLRSTNHLLNLTKANRYMPGPGCSERYDFTPSEADIQSIHDDFGGLLKIPDTFEQTVTPYHHSQGKQKAPPPQIVINPQTTLMCEMLGLTDPFAVFSGRQTHVVTEAHPLTASDDDSLDLDDRDEGIHDDSDFVDTTMETTGGGSSTMETTLNPDEILVDEDDEEGGADSNSPEEAGESTQDSGDYDSAPPSGEDGGAKPGPGAGAGVLPPGGGGVMECAPALPSPDTLSPGAPSPAASGGSSPQEKRPQTVLGDTDSSFSSEPAEPGPSKPKKFKRRNAALYSSTEGDM